MKKIKETLTEEMDFSKLLPKEAIKLMHDTIDKQYSGRNIENVAENSFYRFKPLMDYPPLNKIGFPVTESELHKSPLLLTMSRYDDSYKSELYNSLISYARFIKSKQMDLEFKNCNNLHWLLGMQSEIMEIESATDGVNLMEEIGDYLFFLLSYAMEHDALLYVISHITKEFTEGRLITYENRVIINSTFRSLALLSDIEKGALTSGKAFYKNDLLKSIMGCIELITNTISTIHFKGDIYNNNTNGIVGALIKCMNVNRDKLEGRYTKGYNPDEDISRDVNNEYKVMKEAIESETGEVKK